MFLQVCHATVMGARLTVRSLQLDSHYPAFAGELAIDAHRACDGYRFVPLDDFRCGERNAFTLLTLQSKARLASQTS